MKQRELDQIKLAHNRSQSDGQLTASAIDCLETICQ